MTRTGFGQPAGAAFLGYFLCSSNGAVTASNTAVASSGMSGSASGLASQEFAQGNFGSPPTQTANGFFLESWGVASQGNGLVVRVDLYQLANPFIAPPAPLGWTTVPVSSLPLAVAIALEESGSNNPAPPGLVPVAGTVWRQVWTSTGASYGAVAIPSPPTIVGAYEMTPKVRRIGGGDRRPGYGAPSFTPTAGDPVQLAASALLNAIAAAPTNVSGTVACNDSTVAAPVSNFQATVTALVSTGESTVFGSLPITSGVYDLATATSLQKAINIYEQIWNTSFLQAPQPFSTLTAPPPCLIQATTLPNQAPPPPAPAPSPVPILRVPPVLHPQPFAPFVPGVPGNPIVMQPTTINPATVTATTPAVTPASSTSTALAGAGALGGLGLLAYVFLR